MNRWLTRRVVTLLAGVALTYLGACSQSFATGISTPTIALPTTTSIPVVTVSSAHETPGPTSTAAPIAPSATVGAPVIVTALGNVNIRRGPDLAFDPVGTLLKGQVATASGRDVLSNWLKVPLGTDGSRFGWISIMSEFTAVSGDVNTLPEIDPQEWPDLAWLRNCTFHELWVAPVGLALPPVFEFPNNELRLNPGTYTVTDADAPGYPEVLKVELREGKTIEVLVDGLGEKKKCPPP